MYYSTLYSTIVTLNTLIVIYVFRLVYNTLYSPGLFPDDEAPAVWPKHHFAYIEWLTLSSAPGAHHNMYSVNKPHPLDVVGHLPGDIVPLHQENVILPFLVLFTNRALYLQI
jgi:hypothetical protein